MFFLLLFLICNSYCDDCCTYQTGTGADNLINLNAIKGHVYSFELGFLAGHHVTATFCQNLDNSQKCKYPTETQDPAPMKDEYDASNGDCWYIGGIDGCSIGDWSATDQTFMLKYPGITSHEPEPKIRTVEWTMKCDKDTKGPGTATCQTSTEQGNTVLYHCTLQTEFACPGSKGGGGGNFFEKIIGVGGIIIIILIVLIVLYIIAGIVIFFVKKQKGAGLDDEGENHPVLLWGYIKGFFLLVGQGCLYIIDLCKMCISKITKKEYGQLEG